LQQLCSKLGLGTSRRPMRKPASIVAYAQQSSHFNMMNGNDLNVEMMTLSSNPAVSPGCASLTAKRS
jgi:hypothetical protein